MKMAAGERSFSCSSTVVRELCEAVAAKPGPTDQAGKKVILGQLLTSTKWYTRRPKEEKKQGS